MTIGSEFISVNNTFNSIARRGFFTDAAVVACILVKAHFQRSDMFKNPCVKTHRTDEIAEGSVRKQAYTEY